MKLDNTSQKIRMIVVSAIFAVALLVLCIIAICSGGGENEASDCEQASAVIKAQSEADASAEESAFSKAESSEESGKAENSSEESENFSEETDISSYTLRINEVMSSSSVYYNPEGKPCDWLELYNYGTRDVDLSNIYITDNPKKIRKDERLSGVIPAGGYAVVYFSGNTVRDGNINEMNFGISGGETIYIYCGAQSEICSIEIPEGLSKDYSYAYNGITNGGKAAAVSQNGYVITSACTPGFSNDAEGLEAFCLSNDNKTGPLVIYELMCANNKYFKQSGEYYDWAEIKNVSESPVFLGDYYFSDNENKLNKWNFPQVTLGSGESVIVFCSGNENLKTEYGYHTSFKISSEGDRLIISDKNSVISDSVYVTDIPYLGSMGRMDGENGFFYFSTPTPNESNKNGTRLVSATPISSLASGVYAASESLAVTLTGDGTVYYTTDGSEPDKNSNKYTSPITLEKTTVIRAVSYGENKLKSAVFTGFYAIGTSYDLPVICIAVDPDDMYSEESGIYYGEKGDTNANFNKKWERKANISLIESDGTGFSVDCGIKISGEGSRQLIKKSFAIKFRSVYGTSTLEYDVFGDGTITEFDSLKLRVGEDYAYAVFRDELITSLAENTDIQTQNYRFCVLFINDEYYGIYSIREKIDEDFIASHEECDSDDVTIVGYNGSLECGNSKAYSEMKSFIVNNDMRNEENYKKATEIIDVESLMDWFIAEIYTGNRDLGNDRAYLVSGGKWKWILYDSDWGFYNQEPAYYLLSSKYKGTAEILKSLFKNESFEKQFLSRLAERLNKVYTYENICAAADKLCSEIESEMERNTARWGSSVKSWKSYVNGIKKFCQNRASNVIQQTKEKFSLTESESIYYFGE